MARMNPKDGELAKHKVVMVFEQAKVGARKVKALTTQAYFPTHLKVKL